jgi:LmbE family N-acetylglucosaminyl deacetylase
MMIGAHPDDCDFSAGGCAALWRRAGLEVCFLSATNGDAGHHQQGGGALAQRRAAECRAAGEVLGIAYTALDLHDGELVPSLENRRAIIRAIRGFAPDLLLTHRPCDYHADHRYTSLLVQDASFLLTVPNLCPDVPALADLPVIAYTFDAFAKPAPFAPDLAVDIGPVLDDKTRMAHCHASQVYEWLPWLGRYEVPATPDERLAWLAANVAARSRRVAEHCRAALVSQYGPARGAAVTAAEAFELCEYGADLTAERRRLLFPFLD